MRDEFSVISTELSLIVITRTSRAQCCGCVAQGTGVHQNNHKCTGVLDIQQVLTRLLNLG